MSRRDIFFGMPGPRPANELVFGISIASNEKDRSRRHAENDISHDEADKRPQSLTDTSRRASRERNR
jgi:hypothetical protein